MIYSLNLIWDNSAKHWSKWEANKNNVPTIMWIEGSSYFLNQIYISDILNPYLYWISIKILSVIRCNLNASLFILEIFANVQMCHSTYEKNKESVFYWVFPNFIVHWFFLKLCHWILDISSILCNIMKNISLAVDVIFLLLCLVWVVVPCPVKVKVKYDGILMRTRSDQVTAKYQLHLLLKSSPIVKY